MASPAREIIGLTLVRFLTFFTYFDRQSLFEGPSNTFFTRAWVSSSSLYLLSNKAGHVALISCLITYFSFIAEYLLFFSVLLTLPKHVDDGAENAI